MNGAGGLPIYDYNNIPEPTGEQCNQNSHIGYTGQGHYLFAAWYPQMGGYVGKCVIILDPNSESVDNCFDAVVWHDGEFPFSADDDRGRTVAQLHHCMPSQFASFAKEVIKMQRKVLNGEKK